jgi:pimeloyl-ACP methyl ester carboxylesterase
VHVVDGAGRDASDPTVVLVHGSGHTSRVWSKVQAVLHHSSVAVDVPGRGDRVAPIAEVTLDAAVTSLVADVDATTDGPLVLVGHSSGGIVLPGLAARLGDRVVQLVFVAGLCARDGEAAIDTVRPDVNVELGARLRAMREQFAGCMLEPHHSVDGMRAIDSQTAAPIDSLNLMQQAVSWAGVPRELPRTFVRCTRDKIQSRELQDALIENCGASLVVDIETGHTPALAAPEALAAIIDDVIARSRAEPSRAIIDP